MKFKSIDNKKISNNKLRMTEPTVLFGAGAKTIATYTVDADEICRIDLVSTRFFGTADYSEAILKYNNISNPFSINEGDVLNIPDAGSAMKAWKRINEIGVEGDAEPSVKDQFMSTKRLTIKDQGRIEYLKKKAAQKENGSKQSLPPNVLKTGDKNLSIDNDIITI